MIRRSTAWGLPHWLEKVFQQHRAVGFAWSAGPRSGNGAEHIVGAWLDQPSAYALQPGEDHWAILRRTIHEGQARGALIMNAHLAALALEHGAALCTNDRDFTRFPGLEVLNPLETGGG